MKELPVNTRESAIEAAVIILAKLGGIAGAYASLCILGDMLDGDFDHSFLLGLVLLPALSVLKDGYKVWEPYTTTVTLSDTELVVEIGYFRRFNDRLKLDNVENTELVTTPMGRKHNFGVLNLYTYGSSIELPHIKDPNAIQKKIEAIMVKNHQGK